MRQTVITTSLAAGLCLFAPALWQVAASQDVQSIAAIVNDDVISGYDLERRLDLIVRSTRMDDSLKTRRQIRPRVLQLLIDEKLQLQAADTHNIRVSDDDMANAIGNIERQNNVPPGSFDEFIRSIGVDREALLYQLRAGIAWRRVVRRKMRPIPEDEIEESLEKLQADIGKPEYLVSEILIPVDAPDQEREAESVATNLYRQILAGASFKDAARQFSRGTTAASGGRIGWVRADQLAEEIAAVVPNLQGGDVSKPIRTQIGFYLVRVRDRRRFMMTATAEAKIGLRQLLFPLPHDTSKASIAARRQEARAIARSAPACTDIQSVAEKDGGIEYADLGILGLGQLSAQTKAAVQTLQVGQFSKPMTLEGGVMLLMVCERQDPKSVKAPNREAVLRALRREKMAKISQRYIRDLRRDALVEYR